MFFRKNSGILATLKKTGILTSALDYSLSFFTALSRNRNTYPKQSWWQEELAEKHKVLLVFWQEKIINYNQKSVDEFKKTIIYTHFPQDSRWQTKIEKIFQDAISKQIQFDVFFNLLQDLPLNLIRGMNHFEKLVPEDEFEQASTQVKKSDIFDIIQYVKDKKLSVALTLGSAQQGLMTPDFPENQSRYPFAMHSVGKVFTGILALIMLREDIFLEEDLQCPVQFDDSITKQLPLVVREQLKIVTLYQLMTHRSGLGSYLGNYMQTIEQGKIPEIKSIEDFLPFIEEKTYPVGEERYSNDGILLVGLAIKQAYEKKFDLSVEYNDILRQYIISEVGMPSFTPWKPENAKCNAHDPISPHIVGSPAGGYWVTAEDLAKFGQWIYNKSSGDPIFKALIEKYGQEFYQADSMTIAHAGGIPSSSAFLSVSLKTGAIITTLSDQSQMAVDLNKMIQEHIFLKKKQLVLENSINLPNCR